MMSSILSNISICQKYGSTTALEAALVDKRSILINDKKFSTSIDKYLYKDIEFKNLDQALKRILFFKKNLFRKNKNKLGDWKIILSKILKISTNENVFFNQINKIFNKK